ncbi:MAG: hypothetical protein NC908_02775, partial [Candidatus Omnitrophica bacterium]|nr:hypothetical protein [Candidatus Omnitrophota bacterium]
ILGSTEFQKRVHQEIESYQKQTLQPGSEIPGVARYKLFIGAGGLLLVVALVTGAVFFYFTYQPQPSKTQISKETKTEDKGITISKVPVSERASAVKLDLEDVEWYVKVSPSQRGVEFIDRLSFSEGKFNSKKLSALGYGCSNYTIYYEPDGKIVWETLQSTLKGKASWHGEIEDGKLTGMLSLQEEGKPPQDFSFVSIQYRRRQ